MKASCFMGAVLGIFAASVVAGPLMIVSLIAQGGQNMVVVVIAGVLGILVLAAMTLATAWLPFSVALAMAAPRRLPSWSARLAASVFAAIAISPMFVVIERALHYLPILSMEILISSRLRYDRLL